MMNIVRGKSIIILIWKPRKGVLKVEFDEH